MKYHYNQKKNSGQYSNCNPSPLDQKGISKFNEANQVQLSFKDCSKKRKINEITSLNNEEQNNG